MMTTGISQHWEKMESAMAETAVYASLQITMYTSRFLTEDSLTQFPVSNDKETGGF